MFKFAEMARSTPAKQETFMKEFLSNLLKGFLLTMIIVGLSIGDAEAASTRRFDGSWDIVFSTRAGACDPAYNFTVNISRGIITHPNLVRFKGSVNESGFTRASVAVGDKFASGSGKLSSGAGSGAWSGFAGSSQCSGRWAARRN